MYIYPTNAYNILDRMKSEEKKKIEENSKLMQHVYYQHSFLRCSYLVAQQGIKFTVSA